MKDIFNTPWKIDFNKYGGDHGLGKWILSYKHHNPIPIEVVDNEKKTSGRSDFFWAQFAEVDNADGYENHFENIARLFFSAPELLRICESTFELLRNGWENVDIETKLATISEMNKVLFKAKAIGLQAMVLDSEV